MKLRLVLSIYVVISLALVSCKGRNETDGGGVDVGNVIKNDDVKKDGTKKDDIIKDEGTVTPVVDAPVEPPKDQGVGVHEDKPKDGKSIFDILEESRIKRVSEMPVRTTMRLILLNSNEAAIPKTNALVTVPLLWKKSVEKDALIMTGQGNSRISFAKIEFDDLASPSVPSLTQYLKAKYPDRTYSAFNVSGLSGLRADLEQSETGTKSDIYLISELKDFIHINTVIDKGGLLGDSSETILNSVRIKYKGVALVETPLTTVTIKSLWNDKDKRSDLQGDYSFLNQCFPRVDKNCEGVGVVFGYSTNTSLEISRAGYDSGRIIDLGSAEDVPFESVRTEGEFLIYPNGHSEIENIYSVFSPKDQQPDFSMVKLQVGHVYLARTVSWPNEDLITKFKVEALTPEESVVITYQRLVMVPPETLKKQVAEVNKYTVEKEKPRSEGEVILFNRDKSKSSAYASFNFEYATSGNTFITFNSWDVMFDSGCGKKATLMVPTDGGRVGDIFEIPNGQLRSVSKADFPDVNNYKYNCGVNIQEGKVYGVYHYVTSSYEFDVVYGALEVKEIAPDDSWVRLKFRRIGMEKATQIRSFIPIPFVKETQKIQLQSGVAYKDMFYPLVNMRGDVGYYRDESFQFAQDQGKDILSITAYPYADSRGFYKLPKGRTLESVTLKEAEDLRGEYRSIVPIEAGDVLVGSMPSFVSKSVFVVRVDGIKSADSIDLSIRYLENAKASFEAELDK